jgi:hypothetical protein
MTPTHPTNKPEERAWEYGRTTAVHGYEFAVIERGQEWGSVLVKPLALFSNEREVNKALDRVNGWDSLKAENLKLRAALEEIAAKSGNHSECPVGFCVDRVAKEALSTVKP